MTILEATEVEAFDEEDDPYEWLPTVAPHGRELKVHLEELDDEEAPCEWLPTVEARIVVAVEPRGGKRKR